MQEPGAVTAVAADRLIYANGNGVKTILLAGTRMTLGSEQENDVILKRPKVSRTHARIDFDGRCWTLTDLDSVTGTLVNSEPITHTRLADGDLIGIGAAELRFETATESKPDHAGPSNNLHADNPAQKVEPEAQTIDVENDPPLGGNGAAFVPIESLVPVQIAGNKRPLFIVAAGYNDVERYAALATHLGEDQPLYVLQVPVTPAKVQPTDGIELLAAHYFEMMRSVQPEGPYQIAGYNIGGIVAFEVARQLQVIGESLAALLLIDTPYPLGNGLPYLGYRNVQTIDRLNQRMLQPLQKLQEVNIGQQLADTMQRWGEKLESMRTPQMQKMAMDHEAFIATLSDRGYEKNLALTQSYRPEVYSERAVLILAEDSLVRYANAQWEWSGKVPNGLESRLVPGSFSSILQEPDVHSLATQIAAVLNHD